MKDAVLPPAELQCSVSGNYAAFEFRWATK